MINQDDSLLFDTSLVDGDSFEFTTFVVKIVSKLNTTFDL